MPKRNVQAAGKRWALGRLPAKPETKMPPAGKCALRIFAPEKFALAFSACRLNFIRCFRQQVRHPLERPNIRDKKIRKNFAPMEKNQAYCIYKK